MITGIYYGACYGGPTTAILVNIPGEAQSVVTCFDRYRMAQQGRAGPEVGIVAIGSFIAGTPGAIAIALISMPLVEFAIRLGPPEHFALMLLRFVVQLVLAKGSIVKSLIMIMAGLLFSMIGQDVVTGESRFTFDIPELADGVGVVVIAMGLYGLGEIPGFRPVEASISSALLPTLAGPPAPSGGLTRRVECRQLVRHRK